MAEQNENEHEQARKEFSKGPRFQPKHEKFSAMKMKKTHTTKMLHINLKRKRTI